MNLLQEQHATHTSDHAKSGFLDLDREGAPGGALDPGILKADRQIPAELSDIEHQDTKCSDTPTDSGTKVLETDSHGDSAI